MSNVEKFNKGWKMSANNKREKFKIFIAYYLNKIRLIDNF